MVSWFRGIINGFMIPWCHGIIILSFLFLNEKRRLWFRRWSRRHKFRKCALGLLVIHKSFFIDLLFRPLHLGRVFIFVRQANLLRNLLNDISIDGLEFIAHGPNERII